MGKMNIGKKKRIDNLPIKKGDNFTPRIIVERDTVIEQPIIENHHHYSNTTVLVSSRDSRVRSYAKEVRHRLQEQVTENTSQIHQLSFVSSQEIMKLKEEIEQLKLRKPEEKQIHTVETVREIEYKIDRNLIGLIIASTLINTCIALFLR